MINLKKFLILSQNLRILVTMRFNKKASKNELRGFF